MKKIIILTVLLLSVCSFAQTKKETEEWILEKYDQFDVSSTHLLKIENNYLVYIVPSRYNTSYSTIPIKNIKSIKITKVISDLEGWEEYYSIILIGKGKEFGSIEKGEYVPWDEQDKMDKEELGLKTYLNKTFGKNQLPQRMEKAFINLVKLYGGNPKVYKEAF